MSVLGRPAPRRVGPGFPAAGQAPLDLRQLGYLIGQQEQLGKGLGLAVQLGSGGPDFRMHDRARQEGLQDEARHRARAESDYLRRLGEQKDARKQEWAREDTRHAADQAATKAHWDATIGAQDERARLAREQAQAQWEAEQKRKREEYNSPEAAASRARKRTDDEAALKERARQAREDELTDYQATPWDTDDLTLDALDEEVRLFPSDERRKRLAEETAAEAKRDADAKRATDAAERIAFARERALRAREEAQRESREGDYRATQQFIGPLSQEDQAAQAEREREIQARPSRSWQAQQNRDQGREDRREDAGERDEDRDARAGAALRAGAASVARSGYDPFEWEELSAAERAEAIRQAEMILEGEDVGPEVRQPRPGGGGAGAGNASWLPGAAPGGVGGAGVDAYVRNDPEPGEPVYGPGLGPSAPATPSAHLPGAAPSAPLPGATPAAPVMPALPLRRTSVPATPVQQAVQESLARSREELRLIHERLTGGMSGGAPVAFQPSSIADLPFAESDDGRAAYGTSASEVGAYAEDPETGRRVTSPRDNTAFTLDRLRARDPVSRRFALRELIDSPAETARRKIDLAAILAEFEGEA